MVEITQGTQEILQKLEPKMVGGADVQSVVRYARHIESLLEAVGITNAEVSFLPSNDKRRKRPIHGSTRIPLLIKTPSASFVLKRYDDSVLQGEERSISERLEGRLSPKVLVHGKTLLVEEYLDHGKWLSLETISKKDPKKAAEIAGKFFALLALEKIHYDHEHFYDEIRFNPQIGEIKVTDLGTATGFIKKTGYFSGKYREFIEMGADEYAKFEIPCLSNREQDMPQSYLRMEDSLKKIKQSCNKVDFFNIVRILKRTAIGMKEDLEFKGDENAWKNAYLHFPDLLESFSQTYCDEMKTSKKR
jgi:hypothetical protein